MSSRSHHHRLRVSVLSGIGLLGALASGASAAYVADTSFEAAVCPPLSYVYNPLGSPWTFQGASGVTQHPTAFFSPPPPSGVQVAFLQSRNVGTQDGEISQPIVLPAAPSFTLTYLHAGRHHSFYTGNLTYEVLLDTLVISTQSTVSFQPFTPVSIPFTATPGPHTLTFRVFANVPLADNTTFFDDVDITAVPAASSIALVLPAAALAIRRRRR